MKLDKIRSMETAQIEKAIRDNAKLARSLAGAEGEVEEKMYLKAVEFNNAACRELKQRGIHFNSKIWSADTPNDEYDAPEKQPHKKTKCSDDISAAVLPKQTFLKRVTVVATNSAEKVPLSHAPSHKRSRQ